MERAARGLFYRNEEFLPGVVEVTVGSFDEPESLPPTLHIQVAEELGWDEARARTATCRALSLAHGLAEGTPRAVWFAPRSGASL